MKQYSKCLTALACASLGLIAGCQPSKTLPKAKPALVTATAPVVPQEFGTLNQTNIYIHKHISDRKISALKRAASTNYFLDNASDEIIAQLNMPEIADLYEGLTDAIPDLDAYKLFSKTIGNSAAKRQLKNFGAVQSRQLVKAYIKLGQANIKVDPTTEIRFTRTADRFCNQYTNTKSYAEFQNAYTNFMRYPDEFKKDENKMAFFKRIKAMLQYNVDNLFDYHINSLKFKSAEKNILGATLMAYSPATNTFEVNATTFQDNFFKTKGYVFSWQAARASYHESLHYYFNQKYFSKNQKQKFENGDEKNLARVLARNNHYSFTVYKLCRDGYGDQIAAYQANPEEKLAIYWGNVFAQKYQQAHPLEEQYELKVPSRRVFILGF